jgi:hypothetical protein
MKKHLIWKITFVAIFIAAIIALVSAPALAAGKAKNKDKEDIAAGVETPSHQEQIEKILANSSGPPITPGPGGGPGWYVKQNGANEGWVKYFKHGHPENKSEWKWQHGQYGQ